ncbi:MAG: protoheme IX farnesyltransferase [Candidatus Omnitrophica bacterium]|nr:protoheme IX farnesyltransferase [Candidatus Omnitrophota bacterium]
MVMNMNPIAGASAMNQVDGKDSLWAVYLELGKIRLSALVVITAIAGFLLASRGSLDLWRLFWTAVGTGCAAVGANSFNQWREKMRDARMERTRGRPLPTGKISSRHAFFWSMAISSAGLLILATQVNGLTASLAAANIFIYVLIYTPMKVYSSLCTLVGAVCGAIPPMMGWTAATGQLDYGAWVLGATLFVWQIPHFLSLAWMYRRDYARGGFRMLPVTDSKGQITCNVILLYSLALLPLGLAYFLGGLTGLLFLTGSFLLGAVFFALSVQLFLERSERNARRLFLASIIYLPILLGLMVTDRSSASAPPLRLHALNSTLFEDETIDSMKESAPIRIQTTKPWQGR